MQLDTEAHSAGALRQAGRQVWLQIISCFLPTKSPWPNNIEPKWVHGKRVVVEPDRVLPAQPLARRICNYFVSDHHDHLKQNVS
jgi:hypothetical protein